MDAAIVINENIEVVDLVVRGVAAFVLILLSAMASGSEVAFFSLTRSDVEELESRSNDAASQRVLSLLENSDRLLATILVANNLVNICLVIISAQIIDMLFTFSGIYDFIFKTIVVTFILLLFGEIMPKVFTQSNPVKMARLFSLPFKFLRWALYPLAFVLVRTSSRVSRFASRNAEISIEELADAVDLAETGSDYALACRYHGLGV